MALKKIQYDVRLLSTETTELLKGKMSKMGTDGYQPSVEV